MLDMQVNAPPKIGHYSLNSIIGTGAFAIVVKAYDELNKFTLACKIVPMKRLSTEDLQSRFEIEVHIFQQLSHPGIVKLYDLLKDENNYYIFMEYCPHGELFKFIVDHGCLNEVQSRFVVREILETLDYIHSKGIAHRDMKPENILLSETGHIKLSDFGLSKYVGQLGLCDTPCGSPCYASPECLSGERYNAMASDVWSTGVILFAMLTGQLPWTKRNQVQLFQQIRAGQYKIPEKLSENCQNFITGLMTVDINKRLTIKGAFEHPWMMEDSAKSNTASNTSSSAATNATNATATTATTNATTATNNNNTATVSNNSNNTNNSTSSSNQGNNNNNNNSNNTKTKKEVSEIPIVSVKKVDNLFDKTSAFVDDFENIAAVESMAKCNSTEQLSIDTVVRALQEKADGRRQLQQQQQQNKIMQSSLPALRKKAFSTRMNDQSVIQTIEQQSLHSHQTQQTQNQTQQQTQQQAQQHRVAPSSMAMASRRTSVPSAHKAQQNQQSGGGNEGGNGGNGDGSNKLDKKRATKSRLMAIPLAKMKRPF